MTASNQSRRVLLVSHDMSVSGAPIQLLHLASWLAAHGWDPTVAADETGPMAELFAAQKIPVVFTGQRFAPSQAELRRLCRESDVVGANTIASWPVVQAARAENRPVIWYLHEHLLGDQFLDENSGARESLRQADVIVTPAQSTTALYESLTRVPVYTIPAGIPSRGAVRASMDDGVTRFLTLGVFQPRKGQDVLLEAVKQLRPDVAERAIFTIAGHFVAPEYSDLLRAEAGTMRNVRLLGPFDYEDARAAIAETDVLISPSRDEVMPLTLLEAMDLGKTVIATDVGGVGEWIHDGLNGLMVPAADPARLAAAITRCLDETDLLAQLGDAAARTFRLHFDLDRYGLRFAALLEEVLSRAASGGAVAGDYQCWIDRYDRNGPAGRMKTRRKLRTLRRHPLLSVLMPVYNPDLGALQAAIDSAREQTYAACELCIADDASTDRTVRPFLEAAAQSDDRIKVCFRDRNGHIAACSNSALEIVAGEWCGLLDQDDMLACDALALVAQEINDHPTAGLIYSDEDKIDVKGARYDPFFKPAWNREYFLGINYINHFGVYRTSLLRELGGFREGYEGAQDYDLALRFTEHLEPEQIRHIPRILYHWRAVAGSVAQDANAKPYAPEMARRAIADHLKRRNIPAAVTASPDYKNIHRVFYELPGQLPLVSVIIPTRDRCDMLRRCIQSLQEETDYQPLELIIVDNDSRESETREFLRDVVETRIGAVLSASGDFNFSRLINLGARAARGDLLLLLNNDVVAENGDWLREMVGHALQDRVGAVGARLWYPDSTLQHGGTILGLGGIAGHVGHRLSRSDPGYFARLFVAQNYSAVTAACMVVRKEAFRSVGGFDEQNLGINFNDVDFCLRLQRHGWQVRWTPRANLLHHESASRGSLASDVERARLVRESAYMEERWGDRLLTDPCYNPNLSLNWPGFSLAFPPRPRRRPILPAAADVPVACQDTSRPGS